MNPRKIKTPEKSTTRPEYGEELLAIINQRITNDIPITYKWKNQCPCRTSNAAGRLILKFDEIGNFFKKPKKSRTVRSADADILASMIGFLVHGHTHY